MTRKRFWAALCAASTIFLAKAPAAHAAQVLWFAGEDPVVQADKHKSAPSDYMNLFAPGAPWQDGASRLSVFMISTQFAKRGSDEQLKTVIDDLRRRHVALAVAVALLIKSDRCGSGVEGYNLPQTTQKIAERIKALGGRIDYAAMDEPLWFGHEKQVINKERPGTVLCRDPIATLADQIAQNVVILKRVFPAIQVGEIDPVGGDIDPRAYTADIVDFARAFQAATGQKLAFFHADVSWRHDWQGPLAMLRAALARQGIPYGVVFNGGADARDSETWVARALQRFAEIAGNPATAPDEIIVQSWNTLPDRMLPETDPGALTYELRDVARRIK